MEGHHRKQDRADHPLDGHVAHPPQREVSGNHAQHHPGEQLPQMFPIGVLAKKRDAKNVTAQKQRKQRAGGLPGGQGIGKKCHGQHAQTGDTRL